MKAIILRKSGRPETLQISTVPDPVPAEGEVLVKLLYAGINYAEILSRKGLYGWAVKRPYILGMEGAGEIIAVGPGVDAGRIGESVMVGTQYGCYAEKIALPAERALPVIPFYSMAENAAFLVNYMTAWVSLFTLAKVQPREKVLITAAAGGVGTAAVQLSVAQNCRVFALAGSEKKIAFLNSLGVAAAISYYKKNWHEELQTKSGGVDVALEMVGGEVYRHSFAALNPLGRLVVAGFAGMDLKKWNPLSWWKTWRDAPKVNLMSLAQKSGTVSATHLGYLLRRPQMMREIFDELRSFVIENEIRPVIGRIFPFAEASAAHRWIESRQSQGKVLLDISGEPTQSSPP